MRNRVEWLAARVVLATLEWTPLPVSNALGRLYARLAWLVAKRARQTALRNLQMAGLEEPDRIIRGVFDSLGRMLVSFSRFPRMNRQNLTTWIRYEGLENSEKAKARGRGLLVANAHFGNWELSGLAHSLLTEPIHVVVRPLHNPLLDQLIERYRALGGNHVIPKWGAARDILRALKSGETVALFMDENTPLDEGVFVDFFGLKACASGALARFAHHSGAAVIPAYAVWSSVEQRYVIHMEPEVEMTGDVAVDTQRIHARLEAAIRRHPDQWLWLRRRWKTRPPGEPSLY